MDPWRCRCAVCPLGRRSWPRPGQPARARRRRRWPAERPLSEEEELALGNALLDQYAGAPPWDAAQLASAGAAAEGRALAAYAGDPARSRQSRRTAAQRKRDRLERTYPDLAEAVDAGEMTLKAGLREGRHREGGTHPR